jgi:hypothetical protein
MDDQSKEQLQPETQTDSRHHGFFGWLLWFPVFLLVYFLSVGPAVRLTGKGVLPGQAFEVLYSPLIWLCHLSEPTRKLYWQYVLLWGPKGTLDMRPETLW